MYESHFNISGPPFQLSPDPSFYFDSRGHHLALAELRRGLDSPGGFVVISGEIGAGKTTLVRHLLGDPQSQHLAVGQVLSTQLNRAELLQAIAIAFGLPSEDVETRPLRVRLDDHIARLVAAGRRAVLIIDEAQNLERSAFDLLVELEQGDAQGRADMKVCLVGQPELRDLLQISDLAALRERVAVGCHLGPLRLAETGQYVRHRLGKVGWRGLPAFENGSFDEIHRWTNGIPRRINLLCNRLMLSCFLGGENRIDADRVARTARELRAEMGDTSLPEPLSAAPAVSSSSLATDAADVERGAASAPESVAREMGEGVEPLENASVWTSKVTAEAPRAEAAPTRAPLGEPPVLTDVALERGRRPLLLVTSSQADHLQAAALLRAIAARDDLPVCLLVRCYANNAFERNREIFAGLDVDGRVVSLGIAGGTYAGRAAELMQRFEFVVEQCQPAVVVTFDGSDAALSCGLVASRRAVPVVHVGAGLRMRGQPGAADITRKLTDQLADVLYTAELEASERLVQEGTARDRVAFVGNLQIDALQIALRASLAGGPRERVGLPVEYLSDRNGYGLVVLDAPCNVNDKQTMSDLLAILREVARDVPLVWPMHARTREQLVKLRLDATLRGERIACLAEQSYVSFVQLLANATCVLTDSWHVQEEATALGIPCLALGNEAERPIASSVGSTVAVGRNKAIAIRTIWDCVFNGGKRGTVPELWDGQTGARIAEHLALWLQAAQRPAAAAPVLSRVS